MRLSGNSAKDRTAEFEAILERLKGSQGVQAAPARPATTAQVASQFSARAQTMNAAMTQVASRIQQLTRLAKQTSMFDDNTMEINHLTAMVKRDLQGLNTELQELQTLTSRGASGASVQSANHSVRIVDNLRGQLKSTTDKFQTVLEVRKDALQATQDRRHMFASTSANSQFESQASFFGTDQLPAPSNGSRLQSQDQLTKSAPQADAYLQSRDAALQEINATIQELGGIFSQVAQMVQEQGEVAMRIDENVDNVVVNVDAAQVQLLKYLNTISSNRWLVLKVLGILMAFLIMFIMVS